jgi:hypothetical protein
MLIDISTSMRNLRMKGKEIITLINTLIIMNNVLILIVNIYYRTQQ